MKRALNISFILIIMSALLLSTVYAADPVAKEYQIPNHGTLKITIPGDWNDGFRQPPNAAPPTIAFKETTGAKFFITATVFWAQNNDKSAFSPDKIKQKLQKEFDKNKEISVEKEPAFKEIKGTDGTGFYMTTTDKAPKPEEFKFNTQGLIPVGDIAIYFNAFSNDGQTAIIDEIVKIVKEAKHIPGASSETKAKTEEPAKKDEKKEAGKDKKAEPKKEAAKEKKSEK